jgi:hypothetical protein
MNDLEQKILELLLRKMNRVFIRRRFKMNSFELNQVIKSINEKGYTFRVHEQNKHIIKPEDYEYDKTIHDALMVKLSLEDFMYVMDNKKMPRTQLAKKLGISKLALNFILNSES